VKYNNSKTRLLTNLPSCINHFRKSNVTSQVSGFFESRIWWSLTCSTNLQRASSLNLCLENKVIYFFGDSTIRNFFYLLAANLNLHVDGPNTVVKWHHPRIALPIYIPNKNVTLYYRAHGPPFFNTGTLNARPYITDLISGIQRGGKDVIVILNIGVHFSHHHPNIYIQRIKGIKTAILEHHKNHPETKFIFRGQNVVRKGNEWMLYRFEIIARKILQNMENFLYLNLWDLTTVWPLYKKVHPEQMTLQRETLHMFNHICLQKVLTNERTSQKQKFVTNKRAVQRQRKLIIEGRTIQRQKIFMNEHTINKHKTDNNHNKAFHLKVKSKIKPPK